MLRFIFLFMWPYVNQTSARLSMVGLTCDANFVQVSMLTYIQVVVQWARSGVHLLCGNLAQSSTVECDFWELLVCDVDR